ncbi:hypothetical protein POTOM_023656 [Populus tomentosa]|uniref:FH2 domain-containing protein n=1 Tax=Populus tomentosa TaxID=118781 RepID=A0A8X7ZNB5_POPTO|nr:hypothetical protein POTOM_023656 [Populus tomentosa]
MISCCDGMNWSESLDTDCDNSGLGSVRCEEENSFPFLLGSAVGFRLDSLLKLTDTRARNNKMTLMHYLCKVQIDTLMFFL